MAVVSDAFNLEERLQECRATYKLSVGCVPIRPAVAAAVVD